MLKVRHFAGGPLSGRNTTGDPVLLVLFPPGCVLLSPVGMLDPPHTLESRRAPAIVIVNSSFFKIFFLLRGVNHPRSSKGNKPRKFTSLKQSHIKVCLSVGRFDVGYSVPVEIRVFDWL